jgi:D-apionolactonase
MADDRDAAQLDRRLLDGLANEPAEPLALCAGPLTLLFDGCGLRYVRLGERELVRRIYFAVRDANWGTVPDTITNVRTHVQPDSFCVEFDVENRQAEINFSWHGTITGSAEGRIVFEANGIANTSFRRNRIGFCVLHPLECAGLPVEIRHQNGTNRQTEFPCYIANTNPFLNVIGMRHEAQPGVAVDLTFEGDVFETEDQRNWIDASYKTFCTPLSRPFPVEVAAGERIAQRITIELKGKVLQAVVKQSASSSVTLELATKPAGPLPKLGFVIASEGEPPSRAQIARLKSLQPAHLRCDLRLSADFAPRLQQAIALIRELDINTALDLALFGSAEQKRELNDLLARVDQSKIPIARWLLFPETGWSTTRELARVVGRTIRQRHPDAQIGGGTPANFREFNAAPPPFEELDFVTWSLNPQVHATDNASIVETLAAHDTTVESARRLCGNLPAVVGPIAFKMQVNPYATGPWPPPLPPCQLPPQVDVRQMSLLGAGWTLGSIKHLAECGVQAATYYETVGWRGLMEHETGSPLPEQFPSQPGSVFPLYHVFADLANFANDQVLSVRSSNPLRVDALAVMRGGKTRILIANFTNRPQATTFPVAAPSAKVQFLDERNLVTAMNSPESFHGSGGDPIEAKDGRFSLNLQPFAVARVDLE